MASPWLKVNMLVGLFRVLDFEKLELDNNGLVRGHLEGFRSRNAKAIVRLNNHTRKRERERKG